MIPPELASALTASFPSGGRVRVHGPDVDGLDDVVARRSGTLLVGADDATPATHVVAAPLDQLPDAESVLARVAAATRPGDRVVVVAPSASRAALELAVRGDGADPAELARLAQVAWPAARSLLEEVGLHPWWELPVRRNLLDVTGGGPVSADVVAEVERRRTIAVSHVVVTAGRSALDPDERPLVAAVVAELATLEHERQELERELARTSREAARRAELDGSVAELERELQGLRAQLEAERSERGITREYLAELERDLERLELLDRGFGRLGARLDARMLRSRLLGRLHGAVGRTLRRRG